MLAFVVGLLGAIGGRGGNVRQVVRPFCDFAPVGLVDSIQKCRSGSSICGLTFGSCQTGVLFEGSPWSSGSLILLILVDVWMAASSRTKLTDALLPLRAFLLAIFVQLGTFDSRDPSRSLQWAREVEVAVPECRQRVPVSSMQR